MIDSFSSEVIAELKHYVYRLVDPVTGKTFYVGEGCGNRVFAHVNAIDVDAFYRDNKEDNPTEENKDPAKIRKILEIKRKGLSVIHIIHRWGMTKEEAFEVEAALIDEYGLEQLTNIVQGHHADRGICFADELQRRLMAKPFPDDPEFLEKYKFVLIKIDQHSIDQHGGEEYGGIYEAVRRWWKISPERANRYPYVLAVRYGLVVGVYQIYENGWKRAPDGQRAFFDGVEAPKEIQDIFLGKKVPERFRLRQNPISYSD